MSPSLTFLRPKANYTPSYSSTSSSSEIAPPGHLPPPVRRPRAGTMPSFIQIDNSIPPFNNNNTSINSSNSTNTTNNNMNSVIAKNKSTSLLLNRLETGRHRSSSLNLPPSDSLFWNMRTDIPLSPSSEQLLQNDNDSSIARTMRSLGLEENNPSATPKTSTVNTSTLFHHQAPPEFYLPSRSLLSGSNRNRSYSVNSMAKYESDLLDESDINTHRNNAPMYVSSLEGFTRQQNRPRASSVGQPGAGLHPSIGIWNNMRIQRSSPLTSSAEDPLISNGHIPLSLGDSQLLASILHGKQNNAGVIHNETATLLERSDSQIQEEDRPYLHYSHSSPTFCANDYPFQQQSDTPSNNTVQVASRSLWVGNVDKTLTVDVLTQVFSTFGPIESVRLLIEKECAFINFYHVEDAIHAKEEVLGRMGGRINDCIVRVGYGKAEATVVDTTSSQPTRALWLGNVPNGITPSFLQTLFKSFGMIESIRVLTHKNCAFINFEFIDNAIAARDALLSNKIDIPGFTASRIGFAKVPPMKTTFSSDNDTQSTNSIDSSLVTATQAWQTDLLSLMEQFNMDKEVGLLMVKNLKISSTHFDSIPAAPELNVGKRMDGHNIRELRKRADSADQKEAEILAYECLREIAEISSDYIGNTVVQRLFEKCDENMKTIMLRQIGPHLASISIHKNGTWATQKIIALANTAEQVEIIHQSLRPYIPPLLLDQFGNYAVQCCLRPNNHDNNQFIFDSIVEKLMSIAQGRFGARSVRGILESEHTTLDQQKFVAAAICQNAVSLSTNANGVLLLTWLIEHENINNRLQVITAQIVPHLSQLCIHKLGSQIVYKLLSQQEDRVAVEMIFNGLNEHRVLVEILADQVRGLALIQKILTSADMDLEKRNELSQLVSIELAQLNGPGHRKLLSQLMDIHQDTHST
ncbi:armadillo-type protein [Pilobolus umbonatus]|nr:armadillo-type protein [Pilobolus umbonatus]